jgi:hypothetical protein
VYVAVDRAEWAHAHPALPGDESWRVTTGSATNFLEDRGFASPEELEDYGIPEVHWAAPASFATANSMSTTAGKAMLQLHAEELEIAQAEAMQHRHATLDDRSTGINHGLADMAIHGDWCLDKLDNPTPDDFDQALPQVAHKLKETPEGEHESFDTLRSMAVGVLADPARALALLTGGEAPTPVKQIVLYLHLSDLALLGLNPVGRNETNGRPTLEQQIRAWCARTDTHLTVKPVIDLNVDETVEAYEIPDRIRERTALRHPTCVFPWCTRPARRCDCDHCVAYAAGGATCDHNIAPLCRHHHRLKTHAGWRYTQVAHRVFLWTDPHHQRLLRDPDGTTNLTPD